MSVWPDVSHLFIERLLVIYSFINRRYPKFYFFLVVKTISRVGLSENVFPVLHPDSDRGRYPT